MKTDTSDKEKSASSCREGSREGEEELQKQKHEQ